MTIRDDIVGDYAYIDLTQSVTLRHRAYPSGNVTNTTGVTALERVSRRDRDMGITGEDTTVWHLWTNTLGGAVPTEGDKVIEADDTTWVVLSASLETLATRYRCPCKKATS